MKQPAGVELMLLYVSFLIGLRGIPGWDDLSDYRRQLTFQLNQLGAILWQVKSAFASVICGFPASSRQFSSRVVPLCQKMETEERICLSCGIMKCHLLIKYAVASEQPRLNEDSVTFHEQAWQKEAHQISPRMRDILYRCMTQHFNTRAVTYLKLWWAKSPGNLPMVMVFVISASLKWMMDDSPSKKMTCAWANLSPQLLRC